MKPLDLIRNFVKNKKDFKKFKNQKQTIILREGILKEKDNIDIFTEEGIVNIFKPLEDNNSPNKNKKNNKQKKVI